MHKYELIGLDKTEASVVRRHLHQWNDSDEQTIRPLLAALQQKLGLPHFLITKPRWETNVYPLYYLAHREVGNRKAYDYVFVSLLKGTLSVPESELRQHVRRMVNSEIDILMEDADYFVFIEAKERVESQKVKFQDQGGVRQLVRQYVQGKILEKVIRKRFWLAAIGANNEQTISLQLNPTERDLLKLAGDERPSLEVVDLSWKPANPCSPECSINSG